MIDVRADGGEMPTVKVFCERVNLTLAFMQSVTSEAV